MDRREWLADVGRRKVERFDAVYSPTYDRDWGAIGTTHADCVRRLVQSAPAGGVVLDAACGTGRFYPAVLAAGRRIHGVDESTGMLTQAKAKHPEAEVDCRRLQDLDFEHAFDAVMCIDALENLPPEDWPIALTALSRAAKTAALVYLTVELPVDEDLVAAYDAARAKGWPVVPGELAERRATTFIHSAMPSAAGSATPSSRWSSRPMPITTGT